MHVRIYSEGRFQCRPKVSRLCSNGKATRTWRFVPSWTLVSQGKTVEEARANLREAVELFLETADESEVSERLGTEVYISCFEVHGA